MSWGESERASPQLIRGGFPKPERRGEPVCRAERRGSPGSGAVVVHKVGHVRPRVPVRAGRRDWLNDWPRPADGQGDWGENVIGYEGLAAFPAVLC